MSGLPSERRNTDAAPAKDDAWSTVRSAQEAWAGAMRTHEMAPPDAGFRDRLRSAGFPDTAISRLFQDNPRRALAGEP